MSPEESLELHNAVLAVEQQDVHLGRLLHLIVSHLPGFALPEPEPVEESAPVAEESAPAEEPAQAEAPAEESAPVEEPSA